MPREDTARTMHFKSVFRKLSYDFLRDFHALPSCQNHNSYLHIVAVSGYCRHCDWSNLEI